MNREASEWAYKWTRKDAFKASYDSADPNMFCICWFLIIRPQNITINHFNKS